MFKKYIKNLWIKKREGGSIPWLFCHVRDVLSLSRLSEISLLKEERGEEAIANVQTREMFAMFSTRFGAKFAKSKING